MVPRPAFSFRHSFVFCSSFLLLLPYKHKFKKCNNSATPTVLTPSFFLLVLCFPSSSAPLQKAIRVTTFMQRLKNSEVLIDSSAETQASEEGADGEGGVSQGTSDEGEKGTSDGGVTSSSVSLEVTVENTPLGMDEDEVSGKVKEGEQDQVASASMSVGPSVGTSPSDVREALCEQPEHPAAKTVAGEVNRKMAANLGQSKVSPEPKVSPVTPTKLSEAKPPPANLNQKAASPDPGGKCKMAASLHGAQTVGAQTTGGPGAVQGNQKDGAGSWCQTQVPEGVAETALALAGPAALETPGAGVDLGPGPGPGPRADASPASRRDRETRRSDRHSAEFVVARSGPAAAAGAQGCYGAGSSASLGRRTAPYGSDVGVGGSFTSLYSSLFVGGSGGMGGGVGTYGTGLPHATVGGASDWQMDSVIEQIEKQMAAVLEKIEGDMPSLLEQISDCPAEPPPRARSAHASPASSRAHPSRHPGGSGGSGETGGATPPPLPTSPRPALPSLPHLSIPPPSYPPPSPPTQHPPQAAGEQEERDGHRDATRSRQSPRAGMGRGL